MSARKKTEDGASAVEYGLIVFAIAALVTLIVFSLGVLNHELFSNSCNSIKAGYDTAGYSTTSCA